MLVENPQQTTNEAESQSMASSSPEDTFVRALEKEPPKAFTKIGSKLYAASLIGCFCATMDGYNGSLINNLLANKNFLDCYGGSNSGLWSGLVTAMYQIGAVAAFPFVGPAVDTWGRRAGMIIASILTIVGAVVQGAGTNIQSFMGGSFLLGFGISIAVTAGPTYVVEICHPPYRGVVTAIYHTFWFTGSIIAAGAARGALDIGGNGSWRIIIWLQVLFAGIIVVVALFLPESPRWLYVNSKQTAATEMLIKFHGDGNPDSEWVKLQLNEYEEYLELDGADKRWWDYRALFRNKASIYPVITYFMSAVLDTAGYKGTVAQHNLILINNCQGFAWSILGASLGDKFGRRPCFSSPI
ncbi:hexose transporter protein [Coccidioides immitis RMSCC 3703]|uniref:Hexose transporter protein n=1 Tax=Coccidioides immitis RMSCC 3703 TaxID=454286 RepID=A0A0J8R8Z7_COCIT|nr:hexose transporter protein [Coccidioides immitis RMSCC 3703]